MVTEGQAITSLLYLSIIAVFYYSFKYFYTYFSYIIHICLLLLLFAYVVERLYLFVLSYHMFI